MTAQPEKWLLIREIGTVRNITVGIYETGDSVHAAMIGTAEGLTLICSIDKASRGAKAIADASAETVFDALEIADVSWHSPGEGQ